MEQPEGFEWKGVRFAWTNNRAALKGRVSLSNKTYWLMVREKAPGVWESWCEFEGGFSQACTMDTRELALEGSVIALKGFFEASLKDLEPFAP